MKTTNKNKIDYLLINVSQPPKEEHIIFQVKTGVYKNTFVKISNFNFNDIIEDSSDISFSVFSEHPDLGTIEFEEMVSEVFLDILRIGLELFDSDDKNQ